MDNNLTDGSTQKSSIGAIATITLAIFSHITKEDVLVYVSIAAGLLSIAYTLDKWIRSYKK